MDLQWTCRDFKDLDKRDLYELLALRQEVFVVEQNCPYLDADGLDYQAWHLMGKDPDGKLLAYTRIIPKGLSYPDHPAVGRVITRKDIRGQGWGRPLMEKTLAYCAELFGPETIKISAQSHLQDFYASLGFEPVGTEYEEDGIPHQAMIRKIDAKNME